ncbi:MAG: sugar transferase [Patescibacteria group bacterium]|nr:sugar transferase [Patescibacteria group bacterium]
MDRISALALLIFLSPFLLFFFLLVKLTSRGSFIFRQTRIGKDKKPFEIYKIRTMVKDAENLRAKLRNLNEADGPVFKINNDPRFTGIGKVIAYIGLDEVLQLVNIVKGEMTYVGPRPLPVYEAVNVPREYQERFSVKPGITSLGIVRGTYNNSFKKWMESDLEYIKKRNLFLDIYILIFTVLYILKWSTKNIFLVFYPFVLLFYAFSPDSVWWFQILTFFSVVIFLGLNLSKKVSLLFLLLIVLLFFSTLFSINKISSVPLFFSYLLVFILSSFFFEEAKGILVKSYILGTLMMGLFSFLYSASGIISGKPHSIFGFLDRGTNLIVPYFGYAFYAIFLVATFPFILEKMTSHKSTVWKLMLLVYILFFVTSFSKLALLVAGFEGFVYLMIYKPKDKVKVISIYTAMAFFLLAVVYFMNFFVLNNQWLKGRIYKQSVTSRIEYWNQSMKAIRGSSIDRLIAGYGLDNFFELSNVYQNKPNNWTRFSHNYFVQFFIENGLLSLIILMLFLYTTVRKNFSKYTIPEKLSLLSITLFSLAGTYDLGTTPILLFFFVLLIKEISKEDVNNVFLGIKSNISRLPFLIILVLLVLFWSQYFYVYTNIYLQVHPMIQTIDVFPYESAFWTRLVDTSVNSPERLVELNNKLGRYSSMNADLYKYVLQTLYTSGDYCDIVNLSKQYLSKIPFDLDIQKDFIVSYSNCQSPQKQNLDGFWGTIEPKFDIPSSTLFQMRDFLNFAAMYYYKENKLSQYQRWFSKAWTIKTDNANDSWYEQILDQPFQALPVERGLKIELSMKSEGGFSAIELLGKFNSDTRMKWDGRKMLIGFTDNGKIFYIDMYTGDPNKPLVLLNQKIEEKASPLVFLINEAGSNIWITDKSGISIANIDIKKMTNNSLWEGIFPDKKIYLGYGISPHSSLSISKFIILPTK